MEQTVTIEVAEIIRETENAICVLLEYGEHEGVWIPLSQVKAIHRSASPSIEITRWIADKKGIL